MDNVFHRLNKLIINHAIDLAFYTSLVSFGIVLWIRYLLISYPFPDLGGIEQNVVYSIQRILSGYKLYLDPELPPYSITQYSPLYYHLNAFIGRMFQIDPERPIEVFMLSRSVSLCINIMLLAICFHLLRSTYGIDKKISAVTCVFIFLHLERNIYSRPDSLYTLFFAITVFLFIHYLNEESPGRRLFLLVSTSASVILTLFSKQSGIFMPALILFFLFFYVKKATDTVLSVVTMAVVFAALLLLTAGDDISVFFKNVYKGVDNGIDLMFFYLAIVKPYLRSILVWISLGIATALYFLRKESELSMKFLSVSVIVTFVFALGTGLKYGATPSYFTEFLIIVFIALTILLFSNKSFFNTDFIKTAYCFIVIIFLPYQALDHYGLYELVYTNFAPQAYEKSEEVSRYLYKEKKLDSNDLVLVIGENYTERRFLDNLLYKNNIMPSKKIHKYNDDFEIQWSPLDYSHLKQNINRGLVKYLIAPQAKKNITFMGVALSRFSHLTDIEDYSIYQYSGTDEVSYR